MVDREGGRAPIHNIMGKPGLVRTLAWSGLREGGYVDMRDGGEEGGREERRGMCGTQPVTSL